MRSWFAVFWNTAFVFCWFAWNGFSVPKFQFDPYPYSFLCTMLTAFSYLQGPIIITMAWSNERAQKRQEEMQRKQLLYLLHMMEALYANLKGVPFLDRVEAAQAAGSGIPGDGAASG
jgi:uncharacterized membrane protein